MTAKKGALTLISIIGLLAMVQAASAQGTVDGADFLAWQTTVGFSHLEKLEITVERSRGLRPRSNANVTLSVSTISGNVIGRVAVEHRADRIGSPRGFSVVTISDDRGALMINDEPFGQLSWDPITDRSVVGVALIVSGASRADRGTYCAGATITIVDELGLTKGAMRVSSCPGDFNVRRQ